MCEEVRCTDAEAAYIAGFVDGEGTFMIYKFNQKTGTFCNHPRIQISNTNLGILEWIQGRIKGNIRPKTRRSLKHKIAYYLELSNLEDISRAVCLLQRYLRIKGEHAALMSEWCESRKSGKRGKAYGPYTQREIGIAKEIKLLNRRGPPSVA